MSKEMCCQGTLDGSYGRVEMTVKIGNFINRQQKWRLVVRYTGPNTFGERLMDVMNLAITGHEDKHTNITMGSYTYMFGLGKDAMRAMGQLHLLLMSTMS